MKFAPGADRAYVDKRLAEWNASIGNRSSGDNSGSSTTDDPPLKRFKPNKNTRPESRSDDGWREKFNQQVAKSTKDLDKVTQKDLDSIKPPKDLGSSSSYRPHRDTKDNVEGPSYYEPEKSSSRSGNNSVRALTKKETKEGISDIGAGDTSNQSTAKERAQSYKRNKFRSAYLSRSADEDLQRARRDEEKNRA